MILCVSLLLIAEASGKECVTDADCENLYPGNKKPMFCNNTGYCMSLYKGKIYLSSKSNNFIFFSCYNVVTLIICLKLTYISPNLKYL
ncbi:Nodule Cysteine-Rich (NCR) secreted peptide [Medicago truncatula]|uniref:Nodule Cysteine-Rich (NCR) secreted peptide n=1 Tax=Medicago truncatula TaxID=3880 RepID=G7JDN2_MEDTR|nr:Nodule Cysteine-Rich (NCR) secreted peptide [Medicago truncatula]